MASFERPPITGQPPASEGDCDSVQDRVPNLRLVRGSVEAESSSVEAKPPEEAGQDSYEDEVTEIYAPLPANVAAGEAPIDGAASSKQGSTNRSPLASACSGYKEMAVGYEFEGAGLLAPFPSAERAISSAAEVAQHVSIDERTGDFDTESFYEDQQTDVLSFDDLWTQAPVPPAVALPAAGPVPAISGPFPGDEASFAGESLPRTESPAPADKRRSRLVLLAGALVCSVFCFIALTKRSPSTKDVHATSPHQVDGEGTSSELGVPPGTAAVDEEMESLSEEEIARATPALAARSFSVGDYKTALQNYRILARLHPGEPTYPVIVRALTRSVKNQGGRQ